MEYTIYEKPIEKKPEGDPDSPEAEITEPLHVQEPNPPLCQNGQTGKNRAVLPLCPKRQAGNRKTENGGQLNTNILNTNVSNTNLSISDPDPYDVGADEDEGLRRQHLRERLIKDSLFDSYRAETIEAVFDELCKREEITDIISAETVGKICSEADSRQQNEPGRLADLINGYIDNIAVGIRAAPKAEVPDRRNMSQAMDSGGADEREAYRKLIRRNIEYDCLIACKKYGRKEKIDELVELMLDILCSRRQTVRIAGDDYAADSVKARFLMLRSDHMEYILSSIEKTSSQVRNIKKYLLATLYNAPVTIEHYYSTLVNSELYMPEHSSR